jgi:hypothetical protein
MLAVDPSLVVNQSSQLTWSNESQVVDSWIFKCENEPEKTFVGDKTYVSFGSLDLDEGFHYNCSLTAEYNGSRSLSSVVPNFFYTYSYKALLPLSEIFVFLSSLLAVVFKYRVKLRHLLFPPKLPYTSTLKIEDNSEIIDFTSIHTKSKKE